MIFPQRFKEHIVSYPLIAAAKEAMYLSQKFAFDVLGRNKLYLGTKDHNVRAQHVYHSTGFVLSDPESISRFHIMKQQEQK